MNRLGRIWKRASGKRGQAMSEYLLVISVLDIGMVAVTYTPMFDAFTQGSANYRSKVGKATEKGHFAGSPNEER